MNRKQYLTKQVLICMRLIENKVNNGQMFHHIYPIYQDDYEKACESDSYKPMFTLKQKLDKIIDNLNQQ